MTAPVGSRRRWTTFAVVLFAIVVGALAGRFVALAFFSGTSPGETNSFGAAPVDHITVTPSPASITAGGSQTYSVIARDLSNNSLGDVTSLSSFTISPDGSCTGSSCSATVSGAHTVTAHFWGLSVDAVLTVNASSATKLVFTQSPSNSTGGIAFATQPVVAVEDAFGNVVTTDSSSVTLTIKSGTGTVGAALTCTTNPLAASSGLAVFAGCGIDKPGTAYQLHTTDGALTAADSASFNIATGAAAKLVFSQQPAGASGGTAFTTQPKITVQDAGGNTVTTDASTVILAITSGTPATGGPGTLSGCSQTESAGVVSFSGCKIDTMGTAYKLHATDGSLTAADSSPFNVVVGTAARLGFTTQPGSGANVQATGTGIFSASVAVQDAGGNTVITDNRSITLGIGTNPGAGVLSCTNTGGLTVSASSGVASFTGCAITKVGTGYTLTAISTPTLTAPTNANSFNITAGAAATLCFSDAPSCTGSSQGGVAKNSTTTSHLQLRDSDGNAATQATTVQISIAASGTGGSVSPAGANVISITAGQTTSSGVVTLTADNGGNKTTIATASASGFASITMAVST